MKKKKYKTYLESMLVKKLNALKGRCKNGRKKAVDKGPEVPFDLTMEWFLEQYKIQKGKCFFSDVDMQLETSGSGGPMWNSLSFDRLDSDKGYIQGNIVLAIHIVNLIRNSFDAVPEIIKSVMYTRKFLSRVNKFKKQSEKGKKVIKP